MRRKIAAGILVMALAVSTAACTQNTEPVEASATSEEPSQIETIEQAEPQVVTTENVTTVEALTVLGDSIDMEIDYPEVHGMNDKLTEERVNMTIRQAFRSEHALLAGEANVTENSYEVTHLSDQWISIRFDFTTDPAGDGKKTYQLFTSFTVDMTTGEPILFHSLWSEMNAEEQKNFIETVDSILQDGQVNPITGPESFPEAYMSGDKFVMYYYDDEMKEIEMPLEAAVSLLIK